VALSQLGGLAIDEKDLDTAESHYSEARKTFRALGEPRAEAVVWHQLGLLYQRANRLQEAEHAYRESAGIEEKYGNRVGAAQSWGQLAQTMQQAGRADDAESWYVKALLATRAEGLRFEEAVLSNNIAALVKNHPGRLGDARAYAEQALAIKKTLDPVASEIWKTYGLLAAIVDKEGDLEAARGYRREERASFAASPVGQETLRRHGDLVKRAAAVADPSQRPALEQAIAKMVEHGWTKLVEALRRILDGERDEDALCETLDFEDSVLAAAVLRGIADPESLKEIPSTEPAGDDAEAANLAQRLKQHLPLIGAVIAAAGEPQLRSQLDPALEEMQKHGWTNSSAPSVDYLAVTAARMRWLRGSTKRTR
jgi:tetratricopeptide (TPR) repeat protein